MKINFILLSLFLSFVSFADTESKQAALLNNYQHVVEMSEHSGQTYLSFMKSVIKPAIDEVVENGYTMVGPDQIAAAYAVVDPRVQDGVKKAGGLSAAKKVAAELAGQIVNSEELPALIAKVDKKANRFKLANYMGLFSGGGVAIKFFTNNYAYNVHYDKVEERSGRSYGVGPTRLANDASDKEYLSDVQEYYSNEELADNLPQFYRALLKSLLNTDPGNYPQVADMGQNVLSDFLAVYTAEQARNLMDKRVSIHWDAALLEVTLLASFHAGQDTFKLYYKNPLTKKTTFTSEVFRQTPCKLPEAKTRPANMTDYWQFSRNIDNPDNCNRSGINVTNREFRLLEQKISQFMAKKEPKLVNQLKKVMGVKSSNPNLYLALSQFLINDKADKELSEDKVTAVTEAWVDFLQAVTKNAQAITDTL